MYIGKTLFAQLMDFLPWKTHHRSARRRSLRQVHDLRRSIPRPGLCATHLPRAISKSACRRRRQALPHGLSARDQTTLADANESRDWRVHAEFAQCLIAQSISATALASSWRTRRTRWTRRPSICACRSSHVVSHDQIGGEDAHAARERQHSQLYPYLGWQACQCARHPAAGACCLLHHGSRSGLRTPLRDASGASFLRHPRQVEYPVSAYLFGASRSQYGIICDQTIADWGDQPQGLSDTFAPYPIQG
jgi:hypothetical protein